MNNRRTSAEQELIDTVSKFVRADADRTVPTERIRRRLAKTLAAVRREEQEQTENA